MRAKQSHNLYGQFLKSENEKTLKRLRQEVETTQIEVYNAERESYALIFKNWYLTRLVSNLEIHEYCKVSKINYGNVVKFKNGQYKNWLMLSPYYYLKMYGVIKHYFPLVTFEDAMRIDLEEMIEKRAKHLFPTQRIKVNRKFAPVEKV